MVYRNEHFNCNESECKYLTAYVRIEGKWGKIGHYGSECKKFEPLDLEKEEQDVLLKQQLTHIKSEIRNARNRDYS